MADSQYPYPPDRFDDEADAVSFHGAHRAELPFWRENLLYIIIIGAAAVLLIVLLFVIGGMGGGDGKRAEDPTTAATQSSEAPAEETSAAEEPAAEPDKSVEVTVVNAGGINGLAGTWQSNLQEAGWEDVKLSTADNVQQEPVVFYREEADAATAQALAEQVGAGEARQSDEFDGPITFVAVSEPEGSAEG